MAQTINLSGALTFENDDDMQSALDKAKQAIADQPDSIISMDDIDTLGLHITMSLNRNLSAEGASIVKNIVYELVSNAYSGYIDITDGTESERYHAKEIGPKTVDDIADIVD